MLRLMCYELYLLPVCEVGGPPHFVVVGARTAKEVDGNAVGQWPARAFVLPLLSGLRALQAHGHPREEAAHAL